MESNTKNVQAGITTEAWSLYSGNGVSDPGKLQKEEIFIEPLLSNEVLVRPIYGCWEGNMQHAISRDPVDVCIQRNEDKVILGNSGVVQAIEIGEGVKDIKPGDLYMIFGNAIPDDFGYPKKILAYDTPKTYGTLAKQTKVFSHNLLPVPKLSPYSLKQWAAFSLRYITAWANWKIAYKCWLTQMEGVSLDNQFVLAWGGGVSFAELLLAKNYGFNVGMITSLNKRKEMLSSLGIICIDRKEFPNLSYNPTLYSENQEYKEKYRQSENDFLQIIRNITNGNGAAIFIDNIGLSVYRATLKALARQGVITTSGWKWGMELTHLRAIESINRHIHVHTHYAKIPEGLEAIEYALNNNWMPDVNEDYVYSWDEIPKLYNDYEKGDITSYFPLYQVNDVI